MKAGYKILILTLAVILLVTSFAGCTGNQDPAGTTSSAVTSTPSTTEAVVEKPAYPIDTTETLTWWSMMNGTVAANFTNNGETEFAKELERRTGVKIIYQDPGADWERFNLMMAINELPDIVLYWWSSYPGGGIQTAITENKIIALNNYDMEKNAPNLKKYLDENPEIANIFKTYNGDIPGFPSVDVGYAASGPVIRKDWLNELGLKEPETADDWYTMLKAFKEQKGIKAPFSYDKFKNEKRFLGSLWSSTIDDFYVKDGQIKLGLLEPEFKEYIKMLRKWFVEGIIDPDIVVIDKNTWIAKVTNGEAGATIGFISDLTDWEKAGKEINPSYDLVPVAWPTLEQGKKNEFTGGGFPYNSSSDYVSAITTACKNPELAMKVLDYLYSEEGQMLAVYGKEGVTYEVRSDGKIYYKGEFANPPEGKSIFDMKAKWCLAYGSGTYVDHPRRWELDFDEQQAQALQLWNNTEAVLKNMLPPLRYTNLENEKRVNTDMSSYKDEMFLKFVLGEADIETQYDEFLTQIKKFGAEDMVKVYQAAYDRTMGK